MPSFPRTTYWSYFLFSSVYSYHLWHRLIDHRCVGLFLCFLSCSVDLYFIFVPKPYCYDAVVLYWVGKNVCFSMLQKNKQTKNFLGQANSIVGVRELHYSSSVFFAPQDCIGYSGSFVFLEKSKKNCSRLWKKCIGNLIGIGNLIRIAMNL